MTPLLRVEMRIKLTNASTTDLHSGGDYTNTVARIESICTFKLGACMNKFDCLINEMLYIKQLTPSSIRAKVFV